MRRFDTHAGDLVRITAEDVTHADTGSITSGVTGTVELFDRDGELALSEAIVENDGDDWYAEFDAPIAGRYDITVTLLYSGAQRTLTGEMLVR